METGSARWVITSTDNYVSLIILLAGLYSGTSAPQGKAGSATDVMNDAKRSIVMQGGCGYDS